MVPQSLTPMFTNHAIGCSVSTNTYQANTFLRTPHSLLRNLYKVCCCCMTFFDGSHCLFLIIRFSFFSPAMKVELLILIHELEQQRHLMSPLYLRSAGSSIPPLILATMVSTFSLGASPFTYLSSMTQDILKYLTKLPGPPSPSQPLDMVSVLRSLSATLSACVFQSLMCRKDDGDASLHDLNHSSKGFA